MLNVTLQDDAWTDVEPGTEALLDEWLVAVGDRVEAGQVIGHAVIVKATCELVAPEAGVVASLDVAAEQNFARGTVLARIATG